MKLVALWLAAAALAAASGCSINHRSDDFACTVQSDCSTGRTCIDGFCVASQVDAAVSADAAKCPAPCTSCNAATKVCTIDCAVNSGACTQQITCPAGWNCNIACSTGSSCRSGINCLTSSSCAITCGGPQSCRNITCGPGPCKVDCTGTGSCRDVTCGLSCACDIICHPGALCTALTCKSPACTLTSAGCTSLSAGCNTCK